MTGASSSSGSADVAPGSVVVDMSPEGGRALAMGTVVSTETFNETFASTLTRWLKCLFLVGTVIFAIYLFFRICPGFMNGVMDVLEPIEKGKGGLENVLAIFLIFLLFDTIPILPGKRVWTITMAHVYGWSCLAFLLAAKALGASVDFLLGTHFHKSTRFAGCAKRCVFAFLPRKRYEQDSLAFLQASKQAIEREPFRMVFLLHLAPVSDIMALVIGAYCDGISLVQFVVPWTLGAVKYTRDVFIGINVKDIAGYFSGESPWHARQPKISWDFIITMCCIAVSVAVAVYWSRRALREMRSMIDANSDDQNEREVDVATDGTHAGASAGSGLSGQRHLRRRRCGWSASDKALELQELLCRLSVAVVPLVLGLAMATRSAQRCFELSPLHLPFEVAVGTPWEVELPIGGPWQEVQVPLDLTNPNTVALELAETSGPVLSADLQEIGNVRVVGGSIESTNAKQQLMLVARFAPPTAGSSLDVILQPRLSGSSRVDAVGNVYVVAVDAEPALRLRGGAAGTALSASCARRLDDFQVGAMPCEDFAPVLKELFQPKKDWTSHKSVWLSTILVVGLIEAAISGVVVWNLCVALCALGLVACPSLQACPCYRRGARCRAWGTPMKKDGG